MSERSAPAANPYDESYYAHYAAVGYDRDVPMWKKYFAGLAQAIVDRFRPKRSLDVGCAKGFLVERLRERGVEAFGVDYSPYAISQVRDDVKPFCRVGSASDPFEGRYDVISWIEVAEHMPEAIARAAVTNVCVHADHVLFSSTPGSAADFSDATHLNVQPPSYWEALFAEGGLYPNRNLDRSPFFTPQTIHFRRVAHAALRVAVLSGETREKARGAFWMHDALEALERRGRACVAWIAASDAAGARAAADADLLVIDAVAAGAARGAAIESARERGTPIMAAVRDLDGASTYLLREADAVVAPSARLAEELERLEPEARGRVLVVPASAADAGARAERRGGEPVVVGLVASARTAGALAALETPIRYLLQKLGERVAFRAWGAVPEAIARIEGMTADAGAPPSARAALGVDVAVVASAPGARGDDPSDLEWLRWSLAGVPCIARRDAPCADSLQHGSTGWLVDGSLEDWVRSLERLIVDGELRGRLASRAREDASGERGLDRAAGALDATLRTCVASGSKRWALPGGDSASLARARAAAAPLFDEGRRRLRAGELEAGAQLLEACVEACAERAPAVLSIGESLSAQGWSSAAERLMAAAARALPSPEPALFSLARHHFATNDPVRAEGTLRFGLLSFPNDHGLNFSLAKWLLDSEREEEGAALMAATLERAPSADAMREVAVEWHRRGETARAIASLDALLARFPDEPEAIGLVARLLERTAQARAADAGGADASSALRVAVYAEEAMTGDSVATRLATPLAALERAGAARAAWSDGIVNAEIADRADVVVLHASAASRTAAEPLVARARAAGVPVVLDADRPIAGHDAAWAARAADAITVPHESLRLDFIRRFGVPAARVHVLPDTIDLSTWGGAPAPRPARALTIGFLGGPEDGEAAFALLDPVLTLFDLDPARPAVAVFGAIPDELGAHRSLARAGVDRPTELELARTMQRTHADLALISLGESAAARRDAALRWLRFAACGVPAVMPVRAAAAEHLRHGETAWIVDGSPASWLEAIATLTADPRLRRRIGEAARATAWGELSTQRHAARWLELYRSLAARRSEAEAVAPSAWSGRRESNPHGLAAGGF